MLHNMLSADNLASLAYSPANEEDYLALTHANLIIFLIHAHLP